MKLLNILLESILNEISDSAKQKAKDKFKKEDSNLTDAVLDYYINIFSDKQSSNAFQKKDIMQYKFSELEKIVDANFQKTNTSVDIDDTDFEGSEDVIYNQNKLLILLGDLKEKCIRYGKGRSWCISRRDTSNMFFSYRMRLEEPVFYFVFDKSKLPIDKHRAIVIYINSRGKYTVANENNEGDKEMTWSEIESIQPKLKGLKDLFKHIPLTKEERQDYEKFKNLVDDSTYENYNYTEREKYIGFGHDLTEEQIRMTWNISNQKTLISKYVTTGFGTNLPKDIESKLSPSDRAKNTSARKEYIKQEVELSDPQFKSCNDDLKIKYLEKRTEDGNRISDPQFKSCNDDLKIKYVEKRIKYGRGISDPQFKSCNDDLKRKYVEKRTEDGRGISDPQFEWCNDDLKRKYLEKRIESEWIISDPQFKSCNDDLKIKYVEKRIKYGRGISDPQFEWCNDDLKRKYLEKRIKYGRGISDPQFEWCNDDLKRKYLEKKIKIEWINNLMESTKFIYLLKQSILENR